MTKRTAYATIRNNTTQPILAVGLVHKYSDNYKNRQAWSIIPAGKTADPTLKVEYNTGAFTTGRDWWAVTWYNSDMTTMHYSDPQNFQGIINKFESIAPGVISAAAQAAAGLLASETGPVGAAAAATAAEAAASATTDLLFNSESTAGFKQHILREEDQGQVTEIVINEDLTITLVSNSGNSNTVSSEIPAAMG